jgi:hypothetical protein
MQWESPAVRAVESEEGGSESLLAAAAETKSPTGPGGSRQATSCSWCLICKYAYRHQPQGIFIYRAWVAENQT